jgi:hypothetical protein
MNEGSKKGIFWLASFPKSGNTWTRAFLANLLSESEEPVDINAICTGVIASSREWVERAIGYDIGELSHEEIDELRPHAYRWHAENEDTDYHKVHDAYTYLPDGTPLIPKEVTRGAVCIVRNPLDVVPSYANHCAIDMDKAVEAICSSEHAFCKSRRRQVNQLRQLLGAWSEHVVSWLDADLHRLVVRYEDLKEDPQRWFSAITRFLEIDKSASEIACAIDQCRFDRLRKQEDESGFVERSGKVKNFFRRGVVRSWEGVLTEQQIDRVIEVNRPSMVRLGYLDAEGALLD